MSLSKLASNLAAGIAYPGHRHFTQRLFSRRGFLEKTGLTAGGSRSRRAATRSGTQCRGQECGFNYSRTKKHNPSYTSSHSWRPAITRPVGTSVPRLLARTRR